jgi:hypothetical protein
MTVNTQGRLPLHRAVEQHNASSMAQVVSLQMESFAAAGAMSAEKDIAVCDASGGTFILDLPSGSEVYLGKSYAVKEIEGTNPVTVRGFGGAGTIDGGASVVVAAGEGAEFFASSIDASFAVTWQIKSQTAPNPAAGGELLAANNLSDLANAATARTNLGVPATATVLLVANNLSDVASTATARANIVANRKTVTFTRVDLIGATAAVYRYVNNSGFAQTILSIASAITGALAVGDATITASIDGVPVTTGVITITQAASAAGDVDSTIPTAANVIGLGAKLELTVGGANTAAEFADVSAELSY